MTLFHRTTDQVRVSSISVNVFWSYAPLELRILEIHSFPNFSPTCFDILSWNFAYDFVSSYYRSSSSVVNLRQCLWELCPLWNLEYWKYTVFRTFLLHALTYWAEILHMTLFYHTTDQVRVSSILRQCLWELCPFWKLEYWKYTVFRTFLLHALTYWAEILHMILFHRTTDQVRVSSICINFFKSMPLLELKMMKYTVFRTFLLHALTYWAEMLHMTLFNCTTDQVWVSSIRINFCRSNAPFGH